MAPRSLPLVLAILIAAPGAAVLGLAPGATAAPHAYNVDITSFDGVRLSATMFVPDGVTGDNPAPWVLMTHGWAGSRATAIDGRVADLLEAGYGVLTWDSRGFGTSGGEVMLNSPDHEVKDVSVLIDFLERHAFVARNATTGDPFIGMSGGSYAGGIQLLAAAFDERIDVIAPEITWNDLAESLAPNGVPKTYWITLLAAAGQATSCANGGSVDPVVRGFTTGCQTSQLAQWYAEVSATNAVPQHVRDELLYRSPATHMENIDVPTLVVQGFPDTLFDVREAVANYEGVKANGAPVKLWLYDGGHAGPNTQRGLISGVVVDWFDCHLSQTPDCAGVGPEVEYFGGDGAWHTASSWPVNQTTSTTHVNGLAPLFQGAVPAGSRGEAFVTLDDSGIERLHTGNVTISFDIGSSSPDAYLFASLGVRGADGTVTPVDAQTRPIRVETPLDGRVHVEDALVDVSAHTGEGEALVLVLRTADPYFANNRVPGFVYLENIDVAWQSLDL